MSSILETIILGLVQGLTEFLPISSSGHLVLGQELLGLQHGHDILLEVVLHLGTLVAILFAYRQDIARLALCWMPGSKDAEHRRLFLLLLAASVPTAVIGLTLKDFFEGIFSRPMIVSSLLVVTGLVLLVGDRVRRGELHAEDAGPSRAFLLGLAQSAAILPGISRSGSTIVAGLLLGIKPDEAARFSFLMSVPAVLGAALLQFGDLPAEGVSIGTGALLAGFLSSAVVGYLALQWLLVAVRKRNLTWFAIYCFIVAGISVAWRLL